MFQPLRKKSLFMASLHQFFLSIILSIFINKGNSLLKSPPLSFSCGDGINFAYPFWQGFQNTNHFGYPSLGVTCINKTPTIQLENNHLYRVKSVNNSEKSLIVSFFEPGDTICPVAPHNIAINSSTSFLSYSDNVKVVNLFYNCTVYPSGVEPIKCLQVGAKHSYMFLNGSAPKFDWKNNCDSLVTIPLSIESTITSYEKAMQQGFELKWSPSLECQSCEANDGLCEYDDKQMFSCSCDQGRGYANCHERGDKRVGRLAGSLSSNVKLGLLCIGKHIFKNFLKLKMLNFG